jgi:hypothetical protein
MVGFIGIWQASKGKKLTLKESVDKENWQSIEHPLC